MLILIMEEGYQNRQFSDKIIHNDNQTPGETTKEVLEFIFSK